MNRLIVNCMVAALLIAGLILTGCDETVIQAQTGSIEVFVTDAPAEYEIQSIMVTVAEDGIQVHRAVTEQETEQNQEDNNTQTQTKTQTQEQNQEDNGEWITVPITGDNPFDLCLLQDQEMLLGMLEIPAGHYTQIRMEIDKVEVTYRLEGDAEYTTVEAELPSGELKFVSPFEISDGEKITVVLDFIASESVTFTGSGKNSKSTVIVKPVVKLTVESGGKTQNIATVEGTITAIDIEESTVSILPIGETETLVLNVNPQQTVITVNGEITSLEDLAVLTGEPSVTVTYNSDSFKIIQIDVVPQE
jgi:hypothetical protein